MSRSQRERRMRTALLTTGCYSTLEINDIMQSKVGIGVESIRAYGYIVSGSLSVVSRKRVGGVINE